MIKIKVIDCCLNVSFPLKIIGYELSVKLAHNIVIKM